MGKQKEIISNRQGISMMVLFIMGSTLILGTGSSAMQDTWLAILIAVLLAMPVIAIYVRFSSLFPEKNLYEVLDTVFGGLFGRIIALFFIWYAFHLGALVLRNFQEFIKVVAFPETPQFVPVAMMGILSIWAVKEGIEVLGRWSQFAMIILTLIIIVVSALSIKDMDFDHLRPFLYDGVKPVLSGAYGALTFPFAETVIFLMVFNFSKARNNPKKVYFYGLLIGASFVLLVSMRNILVLSAGFLQQIYFPSYAVVSLINIGEFLQRIESTVAVVLLLSGFVKNCVCLLAACKGVDYLFKIGNYRQIVAPVGLLMMITSCIIYNNIMEMEDWTLNVYRYYALPFQILLPAAIWIAAEIKVKKQKMLEAENE